MKFEEMRDELTYKSRTELFKILLEKYWTEVLTDRGEFIKWIVNESHDNKTLDSFLEHIYQEKNKPGYFVCPPYLKFLNAVQSDIESIIEQRKNKLTKKQEENTEFLKSCYYDAVREIIKEGKNIFDGIHNYEARNAVYGAIVYIGREISETDRKGIEDLISRINSTSDYKNNPTLIIALGIMNDWIEWMNYRMVLGEGPGITKNSIKKAILKHSPGKPKAFFSWDTASCPSCINFSRWTFSSVECECECEREYVINLQEKPSESLEAVSCDWRRLYINPIESRITTLSVGSVVKINDSRERFWVNVEKVENNNSSYEFGMRWAHIFNRDMLGFKFEKEEQKSLGTFKSGDRVFFIKQRKYDNDYLPSKVNLYLGIVKDWVIGSRGGAHCTCTLGNAFNVMELESLDLDVCDSDDVKELIEDNDFSKALCKVNPKEESFSVYGHITLCPVDESLFPKLNKILAKLEEGK